MVRMQQLYAAVDQLHQRTPAVIPTALAKSTGASVTILDSPNERRSAAVALEEAQTSVGITQVYKSKRAVSYCMLGVKLHQPAAYRISPLRNRTTFCSVTQRRPHTLNIFYYPHGALHVRMPECSSGLVPYALRDHCAEVNLVTSVVATKKGSCINPTATALSTGTDMDRKVLGTINTSDAYLHLLPGTPHDVRLSPRGNVCNE